MVAVSKHSNNKRGSVVICKNWWVRFHVLCCKNLQEQMIEKEAPFFWELLFLFVIIVRELL